MTDAERCVHVAFGEASREVCASDIATLPVVEVEAADHGTLHRYRGVAVRDVLALVDAPLDDARLRGPNMALAVRVRASDGYVAAFALGEFHRAFRPTDILLVYEQDGAPLPEGAGPWRLVCPGDTRGARWVRQVESIEVVSIASSRDR